MSLCRDGNEREDYKFKAAAVISDHTGVNSGERSPYMFGVFYPLGFYISLRNFLVLFPQHGCGSV